MILVDPDYSQANRETNIELWGCIFFSTDNGFYYHKALYGYFLDTK